MILPLNTVIIHDNGRKYKLIRNNSGDIYWSGIGNPDYISLNIEPSTIEGARRVGYQVRLSFIGFYV